MRSTLVIVFFSLLAQTSGIAQTHPAIVTAKCSICHPAPRPTSMPVYAWPRIMNSMRKLMEIAELEISPADYETILNYYVDNSPDRLPLVPDDYAPDTLKYNKFSVGKISPEERPQVTSVKFCDLNGDGIENEVIVTDNVFGAVSVLTSNSGAWLETEIAKIPAPVNSTPFDYDGDGDIDLAISAMGYMHPNDKLIGEFHLLINQGDGTFESRKLLENQPRITDCAPGDYDGDGDIDFVLAMFGWRYTGAVGYLEQVEKDRFEFSSIMDINGCMKVIQNDANGDEFPDFVALMTQQHESIVQFTNNGDGTFSNHYIARANHPAFGSSSIYLHDLDGDGDEDILYTNGDMMDENPEPKPYHGARWLENDGQGNYTLHPLAGMPGCYDAKPIDMDGDGDLDVVISALYFQWKDHDFPTLAWLENTGGFKSFIRRKIAYAPTNLANIAVGDLDGDGKPDILGGGMHVPGPLERKGRLTMWLQK
ncbi:MAG: VCBS repeat-containing protein [Verrucomicrobiales bacterium]|nr:VCBS repeat-containing protein [Verrucomicrobiales bacterium]